MNKLNNKGFTLIEILAVVAMITIISLIAVPSILSVINTRKDSSYEILMKNINTASKNLFEEVEYMDTTIYYYGSKEKIVIKNGENYQFIEVDLKTLSKNGFLEGTNDNKNIINPKNNKDLSNCKIKIIKEIIDDKVSYKIESESNDDYCPSTDDYSLKKENNKEENESSDKEESANSYTYEEENNIQIDLDSTIYYSDSYTFNKSNGNFILSNPYVIDMEKIEISSDSLLYTCNYQNSYSSCDIMYEIYEINEDGTGKANKYIAQK